MRWLLLGLGAVLAVPLGYLLFWPVPVDPVAWEPPVDAGYTGAYAENQRLAAIERVPVADLTGPEDLVQAPDGTLYTTSHEGVIARRRVGEEAFRPWVELDGRPLGLHWDVAGDRLLVADAFTGLWSVSPDGRPELLTDEADGVPVRYADDVVATREGLVYFSDASTKWGPREMGGTYEASIVDILEHGGHGRVLVFDPRDGSTTTLFDGLDFANGVALSDDESVLYVAETGAYRVLAHHVAGPREGETDVFLDNLPGFPDNLARGGEGRLWVGLVSGRRAIVDALAFSPFLRKLVYRLPSFLKPEANRYGHVVAVEAATGRVVADLQDPSGGFARTTGVLELGDTLWITSLHEPDLGRLTNWKAQ